MAKRLTYFFEEKKEVKEEQTVSRYPEFDHKCMNCGKPFNKCAIHPIKKHLCFTCGRRQIELDVYYKKRLGE